MSENKNIPELRFPEFEGEWVIDKVGKLFIISAGGDISKENVSQKRSATFKYPIYANAEKNKGFYAYSNIYKIDKDVLTIAGRGANMGIAHARKDKFYPIVRLLVLEPKHQSSVEFFEYAFNNIKFFVESTGVPQLTAPQISTYKISFPSLPEQQKIASFFTAIDKKIAQLKQKKSLLEQYKKGLMQKIFSQQIRFRDEDGKEFPEWEGKRLGEIFEEVVESVGERDLPTYSITAGTGFVSQKEKFGRDISGQQNKKYIVLDEGYFSYNKGNSKTYYYGCVYVNATGKKIAVPNVFISFKLIDQRMSTAYFAKLFESHFLDKGLRKIISSSARMDGLLNVNKHWFFKLRILCPHYNEQLKIGDFIVSIDNKITQTQTQIEKAEAWKKGLLQKMFI